MHKLIIIGAGGFIGAILRYIISGNVQMLSKSISFPYGTFVVNVIGCFFIGLFSQLSETKGLFSDSTRAFVFVGILGGFTTFSAFSNETFNLFRDRETALALINIFGQVIICFVSVWLGRSSAFLVWR
ncbi:MAG: fluoride efflux transporter CrcB [Nitrospiraceae bacterium]|nr:fluoride efflux transporter CrcB [Nitrospiraceae bacterium]